MNNTVDLQYMKVLQSQLGGFNYDNCLRNKAILESSNGNMKKESFKVTSTGTTICGVIFNGGVCIAADTRSTAGTVVADKNCEKIHYMAPNIYCSGAGTAADCEHITRKYYPKHLY